MKRVFLTFGGGRTGWIKAANRLYAEAKDSNLFSHLHKFDFSTISKIDPDSASVISSLRNEKKYKGYGYWIWKPAILNWAHVNYPDSHLIYIDSGSHIVLENTDLSFEDLLLEAERMGGLAWSLPGHDEISWSKQELITYLRPDPAILQADQVQSGYISLPPSSNRGAFLAMWREISLLDNGFFFTDELRVDQNPKFIEHRHDQSVFSLLWKLHCFPQKSDITFPYHGNRSPLISSRNNTSQRFGASETRLKYSRYIDLAVDVITRRK